VSGRFFLAFVVPVIYILALAMAALSASGTPPSARVPAALTVSQVVGKRQVPAVRRTARHTHRHRRGVHAPSGARRPRPALIAVNRPVPTVRAASVPISRSAPRPPAPEPAPALTIRIAELATPATMQTAIDACRGPVEIDWNADPLRWGLHPNEIAEHDYCGGARFPALTTGERVKVIGGTVGGLYVVNGHRRYALPGAPAEQLDGIGDIALQTCLPHGLVLIGLDRIG